MAKYTRDEILTQAKQLAKMIAETEEVDFFKRAEEKIHQNEKVRTLINELKSLQKQAVNFQHYGKHEALKRVEEKIDAIYEQLEQIPIVSEFQQSQADVNDLLQLVASTISNTVTDEILASTGGDVLRGDTGAALRYGKQGGCH